MTKKRFEVFDNNFTVHIEDTNYTEDKHEHNIYDIYEMCNKLNDLNDENEQLKKILGFLKNDNANDILEVLNSQETEIWEAKKDNEQLKQQLKSIENNFKFSYTQNRVEFDKDKLIVEDVHTKIYLNGKNLFIEVHIPQIDEYYRLKYYVTGRSLMREYIDD